MESITIIFGVLTTLLGGLNIFQFIFFRSTKKEYEARAEQASVVATDARFDSLQKQINDMETLYRNQGEILSNVRQELLEMTQRKMESDKRVTQLEIENESLKEKVDRLEKELEAYKTITGKK